ncbi:kinase phosphorylation protein-domain-containing protein [Cytidiella melzeri]|nr:kinase phosphorylation protein-domain-containing protein [Cytidiella melzeri]
MFEPVRGGTRGGQAEFKWSEVSADKDRENYLGHSINAPTGRWQKNKDVHWYSRDLSGDGEEKRLRKEKRRAEKEGNEQSSRRAHRRRSDSRSCSPRRRDREDSSGYRNRSRTPPVKKERDDRPYDDVQREKEREWARRRWDDNARREYPGARWGRD